MLFVAPAVFAAGVFSRNDEALWPEPRPILWLHAIYSSHREGKSVDDTVEALIIDLLSWVASRERTYEEVMDAWRTSCPKLPVWEDANERGLVATEYASGRSVVKVTPLGFALLEQRKLTPRR